MKRYSEDQKHTIYSCDTCGKTITFDNKMLGNYGELVDAGWCGSQYKDENDKFVSIDFCCIDCLLDKEKKDETKF